MGPYVLFCKGALSLAGSLGRSNQLKRPLNLCAKLKNSLVFQALVRGLFFLFRKQMASSSKGRLARTGLIPNGRVPLDSGKHDFWINNRKSSTPTNFSQQINPNAQRVNWLSYFGFDYKGAAVLPEIRIKKLFKRIGYPGLNPLVT